MRPPLLPPPGFYYIHMIREHSRRFWEGHLLREFWQHSDAHYVRAVDHVLVVLPDPNLRQGGAEYRGTSLIRNCPPL